jgi:hypothetical protein
MTMGSNPFAAVAEFWSPLAMKIYIVLMILAVIIGTLFDVSHKGGGIYFARRREKSKASARNPLGGGEAFTLVLATIAEAAVSGEFDKTPRRISHLLTMYGFLVNMITSVLMVYVYPTAVATPPIVSTLWMLGAVMVLVGGLWFFLFLRANVAHDGDPPWHLGRADLFIGSLIASMALALVWHFTQSNYPGSTAVYILFGLYMFFTTLLFVSVPWSKFAHMFFKPAMAYQRRVEEANGSSDLPSPSTQNFIVRS